MRRKLLLPLIVCAISLLVRAVSADTRYDLKGLVLKVDTSRKTVIVSHDAIPGVMVAMTMPFEVRDAGELKGVVAGAMVEFTLVIGADSSHIEHVRVRHYETTEQDPLTAKRLKLFQERDGRGRTVSMIAPGQTVPDFTLTDHLRRMVTLSQLRGKVVAVNFIYTSCILPQFCYRTANHFNVVYRRFRDRLNDLALLTITFDPARDNPEVLAQYARQWNASPDTWHFLTGPAAAIQRVTSFFGVDFFPDEGLMSHSLHTAIIDRQGTLVANIEGNEFTAAQLGDLIGSALGR